MTEQELRAGFSGIYSGEPEVCLFSPGRVNLIGDHTDYNGGRVFPCAITYGTWFAGRKREDDRIRIYSGNFPEAGVVECDLKSLDFDPDRGYANYLVGMIHTFIKKGLPCTCGMEVYLQGNLPTASGLSSSASVEVGMGLLLKTFFDLDIQPEELALLAQYSENRYNGMNCGIMDQFVIAAGETGKALYLDTATLKYKAVPADFEGLCFVIGCTNKKRSLTDSKYNERRAECQKALRRIQGAADVNSLGELNERDFEELGGLIADPVLYRRARHAVTENIRTAQAYEALKGGDAEAFGRLMNESHDSLRDDYEVTGTELDTLAEAARAFDGCLGSRMTGAGFGGCTVSLVKRDRAADFMEFVGKIYKEKIGYSASFLMTEAAEGAHLL